MQKDQHICLITIILRQGHAAHKGGRQETLVTLAGL